MGSCSQEIMDVDRRAFGNLRGRAIGVLALLSLATAGCHTMTCATAVREGRCAPDDPRASNRAA